ncbi:unnamed protein product [Clonostachys rhizophaga]|uniref:HNH nuclease domain-containing protein n=1 Tax=Clonostachys rhizophaga TaxID=160324 RepID=A0A9N9VHT2_9HYPO|nr:unnamed protein product [Clonostachys rhizophaga]
MDPQRRHVEVRPDEAPRPASSERPYIVIRHPAYPTTAPPLLQFRAVDRTWEGVKAVPAYDHDTALIACGIVTGNTWPNGYIGLKIPKRNLYVKLMATKGEVLRTHEEYYYFVSDRASLDYQYPVVPSFDNWRFPHKNLPKPWAEISISGLPPNFDRLGGAVGAIERDLGGEQVTDRNRLEVARLIPEKYENWFFMNNMQIYRRSPKHELPMDDLGNLICLRPEKLKHFQHFQFTVVPRKKRPDEVGPLVLRCLSPGEGDELVTLYHNRSAGCIVDMSKEYLFARFAMLMFRSDTMPFFTGDGETAMRMEDPRVTRQRTVMRQDGSTQDSAIEIKEDCSQTPEASGNPNKRKRSESSEGNAAKRHDSGEGK